MGYIRNKALMVSGWDKEKVTKARENARLIYADHDLEMIVGPVVPHAINGGAAFMIAPDGSKEGWEHSNRGDEAMTEFLAALKGNTYEYLEWAVILLGGDDGCFGILETPPGTDILPPQPSR